MGNVEEQSMDTGPDRSKRGDRSKRKRWRDSARQLMHPAPFRIEDPGVLLAELQGASAGTKSAPTAPVGDATDADLRQAIQTLVAVATALWRVRSKLETASTVELPPELRHLPRHIQAAWDALAAGKIEVKDHKGERYVPGMAVNPLAFQPTAGVGSEVIHETIQPSVFYGDTLVQRADVIVASPMGTGETLHTSTTRTTRPRESKPRDLSLGS